ncbi:MAG: nucleotide sugar dehydrogenase [Ardenticatenaceae bacterium]|nr:nucleotide sugar dehydrogenase [Ardenticatenaceae bacterium]
MPPLHLLQRLSARDITVGIIGLGYTGLPLAVVLSEAGFRVVGVDIDQKKITAIGAGQSVVEDVTSDRLAPLIAAERIRVTDDYDALRAADAVIICVPTPLRKSQDPDISAIIHATEGVAPRLKPGALVVLQSTTYPGTTNEVVLPRLQEVAGTVGEDFFLAFAPERIDPGNKTYTLKNTPKLVGGVTARCAELAAALFETIVDEVITVSDPATAEMIKLLENTFRAVNIGLINETALICKRLGIDVWEVIAGAATKPFGFMPFYPGPGLGGHCIPVDPQYLSWKLRTLDYDAQFIHLATQINAAMPEYVVGLIGDALNATLKPINGSRVLILGVAYKRDVGDMRESPALAIIRRLLDLGADLHYHDPHVPTLTLEDGRTLTSLPDLSPETLESADAVVIVTDHSRYNWDGIVRHAPLIIDTRNATHAVRSHARGQIVKL